MPRTPTPSARAVRAAMAICLALASASAVRAQPAYVPDVKTSLVSYPLDEPAAALRGIGRLQIPVDLSSEAAIARSSRTKVPAVVIVHGTGGMDAKGPMYAQALNAAGIATLEIDLWSPRGLAGGADGRPKHVSETLPDAFGALRFLAAHPRIDPQRVGIMGFSWGGVVSMLAADRDYAKAMSPAGLRFAAHVPFYPICFAYNRVPGYPFRDLTGAPVYILTGADDMYDDDPAMCARLIGTLPEGQGRFVKLKVYPDAQHGFNNVDAPRVYADPYHHQGRGGLGGSTPNPAARSDSIREVVDFFTQSLGAKS